MALKITKVQVWAGSVADKPGGMAGMLEALAGARASLDCVIGRRSPDKPGKSVVFVTPVKSKKAQRAARSAGLKPATHIATLRVEGANKAGMGARMTRAIADTGVSMRGLSAAVLGGKFVTYIGFDTAAAADKAAKAMRKIG